MRPQPNRAQGFVVAAQAVPRWAVLTLGAVGWLVAVGTSFWWHHWDLIDLHVYMGAAHNVLVGRMPYDVGYPPVHLDATYPPFGLLVISPLSALPFSAVAVVWMLANFAVLVAVVSAAVRDIAPDSLAGRDTLWRWGLASAVAGAASVVLEPVRADFAFGQINILLMGLVVLDTIHRRTRWRGLGIAVAAAVKFTPAIFVVVLLLERDWRAVWRSAAGFAAVTAATWLVRPAASARYFLQFRSQAALIGPPAYISDQSWNGILARLHLHGAVSGALWVVLCLATLAALVVVLRPLLDQRGRTMAVLVTGVAGLLIAPISWTHHWVWLVLVPAALVVPNLRSAVRWALATTAVVAVAAPYWWYTDGVHLWVLSPLLNDSLALVGVGLLATCTWMTVRFGSPAATHPLAAELPAL